MTTARSRKLFVNLPVRDLKRSIEFFTRLGFTFDPRFTNDRFGVAVHCAPERSASVREILRAAGAEEVR